MSGRTGTGSSLGFFRSCLPVSYTDRGKTFSGTQVTTTGISISRLANGKGIEGWTIGDDLGALQQLGMIPAMGSARKEIDYGPIALWHAQFCYCAL